MATATLAMSFPMGRKTRAGCAIASIPPPCGLSIAMRWRPRGTAIIWIKWRTWHERTRGFGRWLFLGNAGFDPPYGWGDLDPGGIYRWRRAKCHLSQPW